jgi:gamma-glutamyltranspeptidase/glutathione hydrolase
MTPDRFAGLDRIPFDGWSGVTTPGAVSGWVELSRRFGRLPLSVALEPAVRYARDGFLVSPLTAGSWARAARHYAGERFAAWRATFTKDGRPPAAGELFRCPDHARTLEQIAESGGESFYRGALALRIAKASSKGGGFLTADDLAEHKPEWVRPISTEYHGVALHEIPPNGQGLTALIALGILRHTDQSELPVDSARALHMQIEAIKLAFADARRYIADPDTMDTTPAALLDDGYLAGRARLIDPAQARDFDHGRPDHGGTVYLTAADAQGTMVSFIQSNYTGFGSGMVVPGTGIALQNRGCCFTLEPGHPNRVGPRKRPYHTIIPAFVTDPPGSAPIMSFGVMGGFMQPQGHVQVLTRIVDHCQNPQAALDAPRWRVDEGLRVEIEPGFDADLYADLRDLGHDLRLAGARTVAHGRGQVIYRLGEGYLAASDLRADGQAVGF